MRISYWSSDVCSSDLAACAPKISAAGGIERDIQESVADIAVSRAEPIDAADGTARLRIARHATDTDAARESRAANRLAAEAPPWVIRLVVVDDRAVLAQVVFVNIAKRPIAVPDALPIGRQAESVGQRAHLVEKTERERKRAV